MSENNGRRLNSKQTIIHYSNDLIHLNVFVSISRQEKMPNYSISLVTYEWYL